MRVYISGPITGHDDGNRAAFAKAAAEIVERGHVAVNPHNLPHKHAGQWLDYMREDIAAMLTCDAVLALPGWEASRGAKIEIQLAVDLGLRVVWSVGEL